MKIKLYLALLCLTACFLISAPQSSAVENPFSSFNNKFGIHILFPEELPQAAQLVNSNGGDWGYVVIPIQAGDKDIVKWQQFMDSAKKHHIIPIIRLATEGDYFNTLVWRKPAEHDIIDFANFLNSLDWPVKNRYIIVFNEVNRADEWGGAVNAHEYARLLSFAANIFKSKSNDFFIINAGLDNAAPNQSPDYQNQYDYLREMDRAVPGVFNQIDGLSSHSYPNPGFSQPPAAISSMGITSFDFERRLIKSMSSKNLPVFITETGWTAEKISDKSRALYYQQAFSTAWSDLSIVTVAPFLLRASGQFSEFSFLTEAGAPTSQYNMISSLPKVKGLPVLPKNQPELLKLQKKVLGLTDSFGKTEIPLSKGYRDFSKYKTVENRFSLTGMVMTSLYWLIGS
jgi:hypothetical protein